MGQKWLSVRVALLVVCSLVVLIALGFAVFGDEPVEFPDHNLEQVIRDAIAKPTGTIYESDLAGLRGLTANHVDISDLTGLEHCSALFGLDLMYNQISDLRPLSGLAGLVVLYLGGNRISNLTPLSNLLDLQYVILGVNEIVDISPLAGLVELSYLDLTFNHIADITALVDNEGLSDGDGVSLLYNDLDLSPGSSDMLAIEALIGRGVVVLYELPTGHTVSAPTTPSGPSTGQVGTALPFSTGGSTCSQGHSVQYQFDWDDATPYSSWSSAATASHSYAAAGAYQVKARARCSQVTSVVSDWSSSLLVSFGGSEVPGVETRAPSEPTVDSVTLNGAVNPNGSEASIWFEWSDNADLTSFSTTRELSLGGGTAELGVAESLTGLEVGKDYYYRVAARNGAGIARGEMRRVVIILGTPPPGSKHAEYWNRYDRIIAHWAAEYNLYPVVLKSIIAHESAGLGTRYDSPHLSYLYEPVTIDERYVAERVSSASLMPSLRGYVLPGNPPNADARPYNRYWNQFVGIPAGTTNKEMMSRSFLVGGKTLLYGLTNPSGTVEGESVAQYRLAASYGLGQIVYWWWHTLIGDGAPETLYDPQVGIRAAATILSGYRNHCAPTASSSTDTFEPWKTAVGVYNSGDIRYCWYLGSYVEAVRDWFEQCSPTLADEDFDLGAVLPSVRDALEPLTSLRIASPQAAEGEIDRLVGDLKVSGERQLVVLAALPASGEDAESLVASAATLQIFSDERGDLLEFESAQVPCVGQVGRVFLVEPSEGHPPLICVECAAGAHGLWVFLFRWDGDLFQTVTATGEDNAELPGLFGDAGIHIQGDGTIRVSHRSPTSPLDTTDIDIYEWGGRSYSWERAETSSNAPEEPTPPALESDIICGPNPVRADGVAFFYTLPESTSTAEILIFTVSGRLVAQISLADGTSRFPSAGYWIPVDEAGMPLANGPYLCVLLVDGRAAARGKMVVQR